MKKVCFLLFLLNIIYAISFSQSFTDKDSLFVQSKKENKCILMLFSGSDWCANCIRLEKNILKDSAFQNFVNKNLLFLNIDFPQRKKQSEQLRKQNEALAEQYNPDGIFPSLLLWSSGEKTIPVLYQQENVLQFINKLKNTITILK